MSHIRDEAWVPLYDLEHVGGTNLADNTLRQPMSKALQRALQGTGVDARAYPSPTNRPLREALARLHDVPPDQVVVTNGSNDALDLLLRITTRPGGTVALTDPTFSMLGIHARLAGARPAPVPLGPHWELDVDGMVGTHPDATVLCRPNNPTGTLWPLTQVQQILERTDGWLVLDEAYADFAADDARRLFGHERVVLVRTLSKAWQLAGVRVGYILAPPRLADALQRIRAPFRVGAVQERLALAALEDRAHHDRVVAEVLQIRPKLAEDMRDAGLEPFPSEANFVLARGPRPGPEIAKTLQGRGFLVRSFSEPRLQDCIRVTVPPADILEPFARALKEAAA